jgi:hypothetical protein
MRALLSPSKEAWLCAALLLGSCGDDKTPEDPAANPPDAGESEQGEPDDEESEFEGCPDSTPTFALGMQAKGMLGHITGTLIAASKSPPERYLNDWTVEFVDDAGAPIEDVAIRSVRPFMPVHGHDGNVKPVVHPGTKGRFAVTGFNLNMRGPWEIQFQLRSAQAGDDYVVFHVCVQE